MSYIGTTLNPPQGGTGEANNAASTITISGNHPATFTLTGSTSVTFPTSGTLATTAMSGITTLDGDAGSATGATVTLSGGSTGLTTSGSSATVTLAGTLALANGGTNASLTASNGGIFYSTASAGAILSATATAQQLLLSGASGAPAWSTSTYPTTNAVSTLLYASSANVMAALATANNGVLITSAGGVPSISSTLPSAVQGNITTVGTISNIFKTASGRVVKLTETAIDYTVLTSDDIVGVTSTATPRAITLPNAAGITGQRFTVKDEGGNALINNITVSTGGGNIDGAATAVIASNYSALTFYSNGTNYFIV